MREVMPAKIDLQTEHSGTDYTGWKPQHVGKNLRHGQRTAHTRPAIGLRLVRDRLDASGGKFRLEIAI